MANKLTQTQIDKRNANRRAKRKAIKDAQVHTEALELASGALSFEKDTLASELNLKPSVVSFSYLNESKIPLSILTITERSTHSLSEMNKWLSILSKEGIIVTKRLYDYSLHFKLNGMKFKLAWLCKRKLKSNPSYEKQFNIIINTQQ